MILAALVVAAVGLALQVATLVLVARSVWSKDGLTPRERRGKEIGALAVAYAESMQGSGQQKLAHALDCFRRLDMQDGRRDYSDAEARIYIEAVLNARE